MSIPSDGLFSYDKPKPYGDSSLIPKPDMSVLPQTPTFPQSGGFGAKNETVLNPLFYRNLPTGKVPTILDELKQAEDKPDVPEEKVEPVKKPARQETKLV